MKRGIYVVLFVLSVSCAGWAQEFTGNINGRISDSSNAVIPGVTISIKSPAMQGERSTISDESGAYRFTLLPQGAYAVSYQLPGFKTIIRDAVDVGVGRTVTLNITMEVSTVAETVTVTGESPVVDVQNATIGVNFNTALLRDIPNSRDIWTVLAQTPGTTVTRFDVGGSTMGTQGGYRSFGVSGQNWVTLDGINTTEGTSGAGFYMDYGSFAEIQISAAANSAEVPIPGTAVTTVFKSGGNDLHGEAYFDWEDAKFQGNNVTKELNDKGLPAGDKFTRYNDFNVQLGGPVRKDKFWYFFSIRDQFAGVQTQLFDKDASEGGKSGQIFTTRLQNYTFKLNWQLNPKNSLSFSTQWGRKFQPYRGGQGTNAYQYIIESTYSQNSWSEVEKLDYTRVIGTRSTLQMSINNFGYQFPGKVQSTKTPIQDDTSLLRRGGYQAPFFSQQRRWHYNANLSTFARNHDLKIGYMFLWHAPRNTDRGAPGPSNTLGHILVTTTNGTPSSFTIDNNPVWTENILRENAIFVQDKYQVSRKFTLNLGVRYDRYNSYYPEQRYGLNGNRPCKASGKCDIGPFAAVVLSAAGGSSMVTPAKKIAIFNTFVPRVAFVYDIFGNTKTALKGSWGRYATNTGTDIASAVNPITTITARYIWNRNSRATDPLGLGADPVFGATLITPEYVSRLTPSSITGQPTPLAVDPKLKDSYTDEFTAGLEHEVINNLGIHATWVRKIQKNTFGNYNRAQSFNAFAPVAAMDSGPDGLLGTADDKRINVFERLVAASALDSFETNKAIGDNYNTIEFGATKRMSSRWQMITGFDWTKRNLAQSFSENPNTQLFNNTANAHTTGWTAKVIGTYQLPHGFQLSGGYNGQKGEAYGRQLTIGAANLTAADPTRTRALNQGNQTGYYAEPTGAYYYPTAHLFNVRVQKEFRIKERNKIQGMFDLFNISNSNTITSVNTTTGRTTISPGVTVPQFGRVTQIVQPRIFRLGVRYLF